ncbi:hypothetical protein Dsin_016354 [Dipteronia sinensis]|uniref:AIPP2-like SPOC-like domain-containing protein n=1 Tax=Dipteronia sinensis TaxID=43782 RepID=A0AAE0ADW7_9ROSI|nr:hypothetical protein Dsin_016354 [Dipteronia sinensis]
MNVCQKCGDKGCLNDLIYCVHCNVSAEHRYCLDILPKNEKENVVWTCEECGAKETKLSLVSSRKSERISHAAEVRLSRKQMRKQISFPRDKARVQIDSFPVQANQFRGDDCLLSNEDSKKLPAIAATFDNDQEISATFGNQELRKQKRRLLLDDGDKSDEESEPVKTEASQLVSNISDRPSNTSSHLLSLESEKFDRSQPMKDPIWRGCFNINSVKCAMQYQDFELLAHLTRRGCPKGCNVVTSLPLLLTVEILSKSDVWPQRFQLSPPSYDSIVLYFFPVYESDEKVVDALLDDMIDHDLALKAVVKDAELLIFSSLVLPTDHWRICKKYYMWGVLEPTNHGT